METCVESVKEETAEYPGGFPPIAFCLCCEDCQSCWVGMLLDITLIDTDVITIVPAVVVVVIVDTAAITSLAS